ncbi:MAG: hypothetical protein ACM3WV_12470 [Bacillota bacterium]
MTIDQALEEVKKYIDESLIPARSTVSGWVRGGALSEPIRREIGGYGKGTRDVFSNDLPLEIAITAYMQKVIGLPINKITGGRKWFYEFWRRENLTGFYQEYAEAFYLWNRLYAKLKAGIPLAEPAKVTIVKDISGGFSRKVEKAERDNLLFTYSDELKEKLRRE